MVGDGEIVGLLFEFSRFRIQSSAFRHLFHNGARCLFKPLDQTCSEMLHFSHEFSNQNTTFRIVLLWNDDWEHKEWDSEDKNGEEINGCASTTLSVWEGGLKNHTISTRAPIVAKVIRAISQRESHIEASQPFAVSRVSVVHFISKPKISFTESL